MRVAQPIVLNEETRRKLEQKARGRSTAARVVLRSRIVLLAADGLLNKQIAARLKVAPRMVTLWRGRFLEMGIEGLLKDAPRPGRTPSISRIHSPVAASRARLRWAAKPGQGFSITLAPAARAISTVRSVDPQIGRAS